MVELTLTKRQFVNLVNILMQEQRSAVWNVTDKSNEKLITPADRERLAEINNLLCMVMKDED